MTQPKSKPKYFRWMLYYWKARDLISFAENWYIIPLNYLGLINFNNQSYSLRLRSGQVFRINHFLEAIGLMEVFRDHDYLLPRLKKPTTIIDIGANIGAFSIYAALQLPKSKIYCIEPSKTTFKTLLDNIEGNNLQKQITPIHSAVWSSSTTLKLYSSGPSGLRSAFKTRSETKFEKVPTITLAQIFRHHKINHCDFLKIDCEGAEYEILSTCSLKLLSKVDRIALEFHEFTQGQNHQQLIVILKNAGFKIRGAYHEIENNIGYLYGYR